MPNLFIACCINVLHTAFIYCIIYLFITFCIYLLYTVFIYCIPYLFIVCRICSLHTAFIFVYSRWKRYRLNVGVWRYQRGNQNPYIEGRARQWLKDKREHKDKQRSTKYYTYNQRSRTRTPLNSRGELMCSRGVSSLCSTDGSHSATLITNPVISYEWRMYRNMIKINGTQFSSIMIIDTLIIGNVSYQVIYT